MSSQVADTTSKKPTWPVFMAKLQSRQEVAEGTMAFCFDKPAGWTFMAGQFIDLTLIAPPETDAEGNTRGFSIANAPFEAPIMVATRLRDTAFKRVLKTLPLGTAVRIKGPFGDLRLHHNVARPAVVRHRDHAVSEHPPASRARETAPAHSLFLRESTARRCPVPGRAVRAGTRGREDAHVTFIPTVSEMEKSHLPWDGERGFIDQQMLATYLPDVTSAVYYLTGPPGMVRGLRTVLAAAGVDDDDIRTEEFTGY
jgi:ferredoxin-NADP reductase